MINETANRLNISQNGLLKAASGTGKNDKMDRKDFLNLFMFELSNQNPLDPMDSSKMMASLAQLGSMEQMQNMNGELKNMTKLQQQMIQLNALNFLNQKVQIKNDTVNFQGQPSTMAYELKDQAAQVKVNIISDQGQIVRHLNLPGVDKGVHELTWDGRNDEGRTVAKGNYKVSILAIDSKGADLKPTLSRSERITQIKLDGPEPEFAAGGTMVPLKEALRIDSSKS